MILRFKSVKFIKRWVSVFPLLVPLAIASPSKAEVASTSTTNCEFLTPHSISHNSRQICQTGLTSPSLWWIRDQVGSQLGRKLVSSWKTESANFIGPTDDPESADVAVDPAAAKQATATQKVVLTVNSQAWSLLDYFERYEFLHAFGLVAEDFGYALEVKDSRGVKMATYSCDSDSQQLCKITFTGTRSRSGYRGNNRRLF